MKKLELDINSRRDISKVFSSNKFKGMINEDKKLIMNEGMFNSLIIENDILKKEALKILYEYIFTYYRSEYIYKNTLLNKFLLGKYSTNTATAFDEFRIGKSIADFVIMNGRAKIYEIKTEMDNLEKLDKQLKDYYKFTDEVHIVSNKKHLQVLKQKYSDTDVGLIELTDRNTLRTIKKHNSNYSQLDHDVLFKTLRKKEYIEIIREIYGYTPNLPNTLIFEYSLGILRKTPVKEFQERVVIKLKERKLRCPDILKSESVPYELKYICHNLDLKKRQYTKLIDILNERV